MLRQKTQKISYSSGIQFQYEYSRLKSIVFPIDTINNVYYYYGDSSANNQAGRIIRQIDASGVQDFEYGNMGELTKVRRVMPVPGTDRPLTFETHWEYDSWNRIRSIEYPDGETVEYDYDAGGNLWSVSGFTPSSSTYSLIDSIRYDEYERRTALYYGNSTSMKYQYNNERGFLIGLESRTSGMSWSKKTGQKNKITNFLSYEKHTSKI